MTLWQLFSQPSSSIVLPSSHDSGDWPTPSPPRELIATVG
jgi:hypothetical protein